MKVPFTLVLATLLLGAISASAQEASPTPAPLPEESNAKSAYLRIWVMIPAEVPAAIVGDAPSLSGRLSLVYNDETGVSQTIASNLAPFSAGGYAEYPATPNREIRLLRQKGDSFEELAKAKVNMKGNSFLTAVVQKGNGRYTISIIDDTPKPPKKSEQPGEPPPPPPKQIILYNFLTGSSIVVSSKQAGFSRTVAYDAPQVITDLPGKIFNFQIPTTVKNRDYMADTEVDLQTNNNLSFIIVKDLYGNTAAMVTPNGKLE